MSEVIYLKVESIVLKIKNLRKLYRDLTRYNANIKVDLKREVNDSSIIGQFTRNMNNSPLKSEFNCSLHMA